MGARLNGEGNFRQVQGHGCRVAERQDEARAFPEGGTDGTEQVGRFGSLVVGRRWPCTPPGPPAGDLVFLANAGLVLPPNLYGRSSGLLGGNFVQAGGDVFLNAFRASPSWAW